MADDTETDAGVAEPPRRIDVLRGTIHAVPEVLASEHSPDAYNTMARAVNALLEVSGLLYVAPAEDDTAEPIQ